MNAKNLWGNVSLADTVKPPVAILREQAALLGNLTNNVLEGHVRTERIADRIINYLDIVAPALEYYTFTVLEIRHHGIEFYPLTVVPSMDGKPTDCKDEMEFIAKLEEALSSQAVHKVIESLLAQSKRQ
jgi:hypothetical protein